MLPNKDRKKRPIGATSNIFAVNSSHTQRQDHKHYKSLYTYNPNDLAEYALPVVQDPKKIVGKKAAAKTSTQSKLQPIPGLQDMQEEELYDMDGNRIMEEPEEIVDMEQNEEYGDEEAEEQDVNATEDDFTYDEFKQMIEQQEEGTKNDLAEQRRANFIKKGTAIWHIHQGIKTGEAAISFFAKHGNNMPIKFVNCNRRPVKQSEFKPYDLITEHNDKLLDEEFYTISAQGVTQVFQQKDSERNDLSKRTPTEFLSLSEWMSQSTMFNVLTSMKFFKHYLIGKVFRLWKGNVRYRTYNRTRLNLSRQLIQLRPDFCPKFMEINKILFEMQSKLTFTSNMSNRNSVELGDFIETQNVHRNAQKIHYNEKVEEIINKNLVPLVKEIDQSRSLKEEEDLESTKMGQAAKHKSMVLVKEEKLLKNQVLKLARRNYRSLGTFIRLIDYMVVESQVRINQESAENILEEMNKEGPQSKKTQIITQIDFVQKEEGQTEGGISFVPDKGQFTQDFSKILNEMKMVFDDQKNEVQRVITHNDLLPLVTGLITDSGPKFNTIVDESFAYNTLAHRIITQLENDFDVIEQKAEDWERVRDIFEFKNNYNQEQFLAENRTVPPIREQLTKIVDWNNKMFLQHQQENRGVIQMDARLLKQGLENFVRNSQIELRKHAYEIGKDLGDNMEKLYNKLITQLSGEYQELGQYVDFMRQLTEAKDKLNELTQNQKFLDEFKILLASSKFKVREDSGTSFTAQQQSHVSYLGQKLEQLDNKKNELVMAITTAQIRAEGEKGVFSEELTQKMLQQAGEVERQVEDLQKEELLESSTEKAIALAELEKIKKKFERTKRQIDEFHTYESILGNEPTEITIVQEFEKKFQLRFTLWNNRNEFDKLQKKWFSDPFKDQDADEIIETVRKYNAQNARIRRTEFGVDEKDEVLEALTAEVLKVKEHSRLIQAIGNKALSKDHWSDIFKKINIQQVHSDMHKSVCLNVLIGEPYRADLHIEYIESVSARASGEKNIVDTLQKVINNWENITFSVFQYRDSKDRFIIKQVEDVITQLEDDSMIVGTCMGNKYVTEILKTVQDWEVKLGYLGFLIDDWIKFQRQWMYLENIFNAPDIQAQLKAETVKFKNVDKFWKDHMLKVKKEPKVLMYYDKGPYLKKFQENNAQMDQVTKALEDYLEKKRSAFPRFYFLTNDELLEILSQTRNPQAVQPHLSKCFDSIKRIEFSAEKNSVEILGMWSQEGEYVAFSESVYAIGAVEDWLGKIEAMMKQSIYDVTKRAFQQYPSDGTQRDEWLFNYAAQPILTIDMVYWTAGVSHAIMEIQSGRENDALKTFRNFSERQLKAMISLVRGNLDALQRQMMGALIVLDVHNRTVVDNMIRTKVDNIESFDWTKQLRYYWEEIREFDGEPFKGDDTSLDCFCKQTNTRFRYGYEYLGNGPRLVITPLTDKCYMTLTGALHLNFGGNPQGPAGTGKTETTKDLAKAIANMCIVFNCSDGLDAKQMARFFIGLASGGAWSCFDEFNRINIEVLSVIGTQILTIQTAVRERKEKFDFEGQIVPLNLRFGVFITMNPGYAGRTELPDNLKALFRPISMMIPDYRLIAEIMLYSEGFEGAPSLAKKMVKLYSLSSEQLSKQDHYDFGMRAVKSVLVMAGQLKRKDKENKEDESILLIRAMRDSNVPKFLSQDLPLFSGIIQDLFPGIVVPVIDYGLVDKAIRNCLRNEKKQCKEEFIKKIIQLLETMQVRHGNMVVGSTGTGKTTLSNTLKNALTSLYKEGHKDYWYKPVVVDTLNPKAVTMGELFGEVNKFTLEWTEGIVSAIVKKAVEDMENEHENFKKKWIMFDGPVDALWIENMNTVLDDNKMLCLNNGQRIKMPETATMLFEVNDLKVASPATVSRCGMVYIEPVHLGWLPLLDTWYEEMKGDPSAEPPIPPIIIEPHLAEVHKILKDVFTRMLNIIRNSCKEMVASVDTNLVSSCLKLIQIFLNQENIKLDDPEKVSSPSKAVLTYIAFSVIWSLGANLHESSRIAFGSNLKGELTKCGFDFPSESQDVYDFGIDTETHTLQLWFEQLPKWDYNPQQEFFDILVPTNDTVKYKYLLSTLMKQGKNCLLLGETGVGKSVITKDFLVNINPETFVTTFVNFSGKTSTKNLQDAFEGNLARKRKTLLAPEQAGKKMIFFIDDVNMPVLDKYFSQPPCELLRQTIDSGGFYDIKQLVFKKVKDVQFIAACAPPGGGRNPVTPRLFRHFNMIWIPDLSSASMKQIFSQILKGYLSQKQGEGNLAHLSDQIVNNAVQIYGMAKSNFLPTPTKSHYTFNLRDMSKVIQGMTMCGNESIEDRDYLIKLYMHETYRVFRDRLIDEVDKNLFNDLSSSILENNNLSPADEDIKELYNVLFGTIEDQRTRAYQKLSPAQELIPKLDMLLHSYNSESGGDKEQNRSEMSLVFFEDCIQHLMRIARILKQPRGNALLVGVGGSGRRSMAKFAAYINEPMDTFQIELKKNYKEKEFQEDIKRLLTSTGYGENEQQFIFSDNQIVSENFLEDINNLLNTGEIPNLFPKEEKDAIIDEISDRAEKAGVKEKAQYYAYFVKQCRAKLHLVLVFSPVGNKFRERARQFPSIINCCTIDWYLPWPEDALYSVASREFQQVQDELNIKELVPVLALATCNLHKSVKTTSDLYFDELRRRTYTTPTSYLDLVKTFIELLRQIQAVIPAQINTYEAGLTRLAQTNIIVSELENELKIMAPEIERKKKESVEAAIYIDQQTDIAIVQEKQTEVEAKEAQKFHNDANAIKQDCDRELGKALPALKSAMASLEVLKPSDIGEMRGYKEPPADLKLLLQAVMFLLGEKGEWPEAVQIMKDPAEFIKRLKIYDKDNIKEKTLKGLKKFVQDPRLEPSAIRAKSVAGESIAKWVHAMDTYAECRKIVVPKERDLADAKAKLAVVEKTLNEKRIALDKVRRDLRQLEDNQKETQKTLQKLETTQEENITKLNRAGNLTRGLENESKRWAESIVQLSKDKENMVGNIVLAAGYISYVGCFTSKYRQLLLNGWMKFLNEKNLKFSSDFSVAKILGDPMTIREWNIKGLPQDTLSVENGIIATKAKRWPLMIDPQSQGNKWIKNMQRENNLQEIKLTDAKFINKFEPCIRSGIPVLLENIEEVLDPQLDPVLSQEVFKQGGTEQIKLGGETIPYNKDFKFYMTTKLANPHYLPDVCIKVTLINFTVTLEGLEDQLLVEVVKCEQPELEETRNNLIIELSDFKRQLKNSEDKILKFVAEAGKEILDNDTLVNELNSSKAKATTINERMEESERISYDIARDRENYRGVAIRGSVLYFVIADLANINFMYQYSLEFFLKLFVLRLKNSKKSDVMEERLQILIDDITNSVYTNICRGLFEQDKLMFSFMNTANILRRGSLISVDEWNFFLRGSVTDFRSIPNNVDYIDEVTWHGLLGLQETHPNFRDISKSFQDAGDKMTWKTIMREENPEKVPLPAVYAEKLTEFQHLMLIKVLRKTKMIYSIKQFISKTLGKYFIESPPMKLEEVLADSTPSTPIIFVLSPGADPIAYLIALAEKKNMKDKLKTISLGQGQDLIATKLIDEGSKNGLWICFQNCHLFTSWMSEFEKLLEKQNLDPSMIHADYRLWLTSDPTASFPVPILQSGIKLTQEPPRGLKANMARTFQDIGRQRYEEECDKGREYRKLVFALAYFHSAILERRKYGAIGWNVSYQWMNSDFNTSEQQLMMYLNEQPEVPYQALNYLVALVNYGGRVTDDKDVRLIEAMLKRYFCPEIMSDVYKLSKLSFYYAPADGTYDQAVAYINSLPLDEDPEVFGLHSNANILYENNLINSFLDCILSVQPRVKGKGDALKPEDIVRNKAIEMFQKLPPQLDKKSAHKETFVKDSAGIIQNSLGVFCEQEVDRFNRLLAVIRGNLEQLDKAIQGTVVMSQDLENIFTSFTNMKTPENWLSTTLGYPCLKPVGSWFIDFLQRLQFMKDWLEKGTPNSFWLPAFFFPQGFMTATMQTYARQTKTPIDTLAFRTNVMPLTVEEIQEKPEIGVNIHGMFMQGAKWDYNKKCVEDSDPKVAIIQFPVIWVEPIEDKDYNLDKKYQCPLYKTSVRAGELSTTGHSTNFVLFIDLPSEQGGDYWVRRGAALLCMTDE